MRSALVVAGPSEARAGDAEAPLERVVDAVAPLVEDVVVACPDERRSAVATALDDVSHRLAVDPTVDGGPIAAIRAGSRLATGSSVAVVAGDAPTVDACLLEDCFEACETAAIPRSDGWLYPLHAVYDTAAVRTACDRTLATGSRRLVDALARLEDVAVVDAPDLERSDEPTGARNPDATTPASVVGG